MAEKYFCCICKKELDISKSPVPPLWYAKYSGSKVIQVICSDCIKNPESKKVY